jgi:hypothetical protein
MQVNVTHIRFKVVEPLPRSYKSVSYVHPAALMLS